MGQPRPASGNLQTDEDAPHTYSPTASSAAFLILMQISATENLELRHLDGYCIGNQYTSILHLQSQTFDNRIMFINNSASCFTGYRMITIDIQ
jgi:hypothetical protein